MSDEVLTTKAGKVEITSRWFSGCWPQKLEHTPKSLAKMEKLVKEYEKLKRSRSKTKILIKIKEIEVTAQDLGREVTKAAKGNKKFIAKFQKNMSLVVTLAQKQSKAMADTGNKSTTIWEKDLADSVKDKLAPDIKKIGGFKLGARVARVRIPEIVLIELEDRNADTQMYRELDKVHQAFGDQCAKAINKIVGDKTHISQQTLKKMNDAIEEWSTKFEKATRYIPDQIVAKVAIHESIAKVYKRDRTIGFVKSGTGLAISTAALFAPGTQALAIAGAVRSGVALAKEIASYAMNIEQKLTSLKGYIKALEVAYTNAASKVTTELTASLLNGALGIDVLPTIKKALDDYSDVSKNTSLSYSKLQKKQAKIMTMMAYLEKLNAQLTKATINKSELKKSKTGKSIIKLEKNFEKLLENAHKSSERINKAEKELPKLKQKLLLLNKNPTALKVGAGLMRTAGSLAWSIGGTVDAGFVKNSAEQSAALFMNSMMIIQDIEDAVIDHM